MIGDDRHLQTSLPIVVQLVVHDITIYMSAGPVVVVLEVVDRGLEQVYQGEGTQYDQ